MNTINVAGNVVAKPELRYTASGHAQTTMRIGVNRRYQQNGEWKQEATFVSVVCFGELAEGVEQEIDKGVKVMVSGRLNVREYETKDGQKRTITEIVAEDVGVAVRKAGRNAKTSVPAQTQISDEDPF